MNYASDADAKYVRNVINEAVFINGNQGMEYAAKEALGCTRTAL